MKRVVVKCDNVDTTRRVSFTAAACNTRLLVDGNQRHASDAYGVRVRDRPVWDGLNSTDLLSGSIDGSSIFNETPLQSSHSHAPLQQKASTRRCSFLKAKCASRCQDEFRRWFSKHFLDSARSTKHVKSDADASEYQPLHCDQLRTPSNSVSRNRKYSCLSISTFSPPYSGSSTLSPSWTDIFTVSPA